MQPISQVPSVEQPISQEETTTSLRYRGKLELICLDGRYYDALGREWAYLPMTRRFAQRQRTGTIYELADNTTVWGKDTNLWKAAS